MENLRELKPRLPLDSEPCVLLQEVHQREGHGVHSALLQLILWVSLHTLVRDSRYLLALHNLPGSMVAL